MAFPVEITSKVGIGKNNIKYSYYCKWLMPIVAYTIIHLDETEAPIKISKALGFIICREAIYLDFYKLMEPLYKGTICLALNLFDCFRWLREDIREHSLRKGSSMWKSKLNNSNLVLIEDIEVER